MDSTRALWEQIEKIGRKPEPVLNIGDPDVAFQALEDVRDVDCTAFMFMGESKNGQFWMFKHIDTRRYIYLPIPRGPQE